VELPHRGLRRLVPSHLKEDFYVKILVYIKEAPDVAVPLLCENYSGELRVDWSVARMDPADASSLEEALSIKQTLAETHITLIHLGRSPGLVRQGLALGCDDAFCVREESHLTPVQKSIIFARVARILGFDLILTGAKSRDTGHGQVGVLLATELNLPYAGPAVSLETKGQSLTLFRQLAGGYRERVEAPLPIVVAMDAAETHRSASFTDLLEARSKKIEWVSLPDIGLPESTIKGFAPLIRAPALPRGEAQIRTGS
jgi:electron transfer flavoprotein beta subunit